MAKTKKVSKVKRNDPPPSLLEAVNETENLLNALTPKEASAEQLKNSLIKNLVDFRAAAQSPALMGRIPIDRLAPELSLLVATRCENEKWRLAVRGSALRSVATRLGDYKSLMWDLLPNDFWADARRQEAYDEFRVSRNAAGDWRHFINTLQDDAWMGDYGVSTGLPTLDKHLRGLKGLTVIGGGRGVWKSTFAIQIILRALKDNPKLCVLMMSMDMEKRTLYERVLCREIGSTYRELYENSASRVDEIEAASQRLRETVLTRWRIITRKELEDASAPEWDPAEQENLPPKEIHFVVSKFVRELKETCGATKVLFVLDLIQQLPVLGTDSHSMDAYKQRLDFVQRVGVEFGIDGMHDAPVLALSEIRKSDGVDREISADDLLGSSQLQSAASTILLLFPDVSRSSSADRSALTMRIAKGRDGVERTDVALNFDFLNYTFHEVDNLKAPAKKAPATRRPPGRPPKKAK